MPFDIWEESALIEVQHMQTVISERRDQLRQKVTEHMEPEQLQALLAAIYANGVMDSALWRLEARLRGGATDI